MRSRFYYLLLLFTLFTFSIEAHAQFNLMDFLKNFTNFGGFPRSPQSPSPSPSPRPRPSPSPRPNPTTPTPAPAPSPQPSPSQVQILQLQTPNLSGRPGETVTAVTQFNAVPMDQDYGVFVHITRPDGSNVFGADYYPKTSTWSGLVRYNNSLKIPSNMAAGKYDIRMGLYENVAPYENRVPLARGSGVTEDGERRYIVGSLTISGSPVSPSPSPSPSPAPSPNPPPTGSSSGPAGQDANQYVLTFNEEFDSWRPNVWNDHIWYESSNPTKNYTVENGSLKIWPQRDASGKFFNRTIDTDGKYTQTYGFFEIEAKLPVGKGTWPAFWLFAHPGDRRPEIDVMEAYAGGGPSSGWSDANFHPTAFAATVWRTDGDNLGHKTLQTGDLSAGFHKYAVKWEPNRLTFYFDGREFWSLNASFSDPMYLMLDLWYGSASGQPDNSTPQGKGNSFEVRYVRAWRFR